LYPQADAEAEQRRRTVLGRHRESDRELLGMRLEQFGDRGPDLSVAQGKLSAYDVVLPSAGRELHLEDRPGLVADRLVGPGWGLLDGLVPEPLMAFARRLLGDDRGLSADAAARAACSARIEAFSNRWP
jgi:hypothetical protein